MKYLKKIFDKESKFNVGDHVKFKNDNEIYTIVLKNTKLGQPYMVAGPIFCNAADVTYFSAKDSDFIPLTKDELEYIESRKESDKYNL